MVSNEGLAKLGLDLELDKTTNQQGVVFRILDPSISRWGLSKIHPDYTLPPSLDALFPTPPAAAHFDWHLYRESRRIGPSQVDIEFTKLREISEMNLVSDGPNMIVEDGDGGNVVLIDVSEGRVYGMKLTNKIKVPLYVSVFYFGSSDPIASVSTSNLFFCPVILKKNLHNSTFTRSFHIYIPIHS